MSTARVDGPLSIPLEWSRWIAENKMLNIGDEHIIATLVSNGLDESQAREAVQGIRKSDSTFQAGFHNTQRLRKLESVLNALEAMASLDPTYELVPRKARLSRDQFLIQHYASSRPVILIDLMNNWKAVNYWTPEYLKKKCGDVLVEVMTERNQDPNYEVNMEKHKTRILFRDFVDMAFSGSPTNDYYMTGNNHFLEIPEVQCLLEDIEVCSEYLNPEVPGYSFFWFGPGGVETKPHHDELNILMCQVIGRKKITLVSPYQTHLLYNKLGVYSDVDWNSPSYERYPLFKKATMIDLTLCPGESLFIPVGWWHRVQGMEPSLSISFSNFVFPNEFQYFDPEIRD